jgi:hypothetical protein
MHMYVCMYVTSQQKLAVVHDGLVGGVRAQRPHTALGGRLTRTLGHPCRRSRDVRLHDAQCAAVHHGSRVRYFRQSGETQRTNARLQPCLQK